MFLIEKINRQWGKIPKAPKGKNTYEIDLVALNEQTKEIGFYECKWKTLTFNQSLKFLEELKQKLKFIDWNLDNRKEYFGLIGKKIDDKEKIRAIGYGVWDLEDY